MADYNLSTAFNRLSSSGPHDGGRERPNEYNVSCWVLHKSLNQPRETVKMPIVEKMGIARFAHKTYQGAFSRTSAGGNDAAEAVGARGDSTEAHKPTREGEGEETAAAKTNLYQPPGSPGAQHSEQTSIEGGKKSLEVESNPMEELVKIRNTAARNLAIHFTVDWSYIILGRTRSGGSDSLGNVGRTRMHSALRLLYAGEDHPR